MLRDSPATRRLKAEYLAALRLARDEAREAAGARTSFARALDTPAPAPRRRRRVRKPPKPTRPRVWRREEYDDRGGVYLGPWAVPWPLAIAAASRLPVPRPATLPDEAAWAQDVGPAVHHHGWHRRPSDTTVEWPAYAWSVRDDSDEFYRAAIYWWAREPEAA